MTIYDEIVSPFDRKNTIDKLIDVYTNERVKSGDGMYYLMTRPEKENNDVHIEYIKKFHQYIKNENYGQLFNNIKAVNPEMYDSFFKQLINKTDENNRKQLINKINSDTFYPLSKFKKIFENFATFDDFYSYYNNIDYDVIRELRNMVLYTYSKEEQYNKLKEKGYSDNQLNEINFYDTFMRNLDKKFYGGMGVMGVHVEPSRFHIVGTNFKREKADIKFYLNADADTYKVARLFQEECDKQDLNYYYKVIDPYDEYTRNDKMCIYSSYENVDKFLSIIRKIKEENKDIVFSEPPVLSGTIDGYIGVGQDRIKDENISYNHTMAIICYEEIDRMLKSIPKNQIKMIVESYPDKKEELKNNIIKRASNLGLSEEKICLKEEAISRLNIEDSSLTRQNIIQDLPLNSKENQEFKSQGMTEEEIRRSRELLGFGDNTQEQPKAYK